MEASQICFKSPCDTIDQIITVNFGPNVSKHEMESFSQSSLKIDFC